MSPELSETDQAAGELKERLVDLGPALEAHQEAAELMQPG